MDYSNLPRGRRKTTALPRLILAGSIVMLSAVAGFVFYEYRTHAEWFNTLAEYRENVTNWLAERKNNMHHGIAKVRSQPAANDDDDRPVNFEFYNTLQEMKSMSVDARNAVEAKQAEKVSAAPVTKIASQKSNDAVQTNKKSQSAKISHAADLEKDLLAAMKKNGGGN